jgi:hypothetical protein
MTFKNPMKFLSSKESEIGKKKGEKPSEEKPSEQPHPKLKPKPMRFHSDYCGRDDHKGELLQEEARGENGKGVG